MHIHTHKEIKNMCPLNILQYLRLKEQRRLANSQLSNKPVFCPACTAEACKLQLQRYS